MSKGGSKNGKLEGVEVAGADLETIKWGGLGVGRGGSRHSKLGVGLQRNSIKSARADLRTVKWEGWRWAGADLGTVKWSRVKVDRGGSRNSEMGSGVGGRGGSRDGKIGGWRCSGADLGTKLADFQMYNECSEQGRMEGR